jgi:hypothetical protein
MKNLNSILGLLLLFLTVAANAQEVIHFQNPSFEDHPRRGGEYSTAIQGWKDCGLLYFPVESPPDIHPVPIIGNSGAWGVTMLPHEGQTYLGLVARYTDSWESVSQKLESPLQKDSCYQFSVWLSRFDTYLSPTPRSRSTPENFTQPISLYVWGGGNTPCVMSRVLGVAGPIDHSEWKEYIIEFTPTQDVKSIVLQAYYYAPNNNDQLFEPSPYNGHVLVDNLSPISKVQCK